MLNLAEKCRFCKSINVSQILEPTTSIHFGRISCGECKRHIRWLPKPKTPDISIVRLLHGTGLEPWERKFLKAIACRSPTKTEVIVIEAIGAKVKPVVGRASG